VRSENGRHPELPTSRHHGGWPQDVLCAVPVASTRKRITDGYPEGSFGPVMLRNERSGYEHGSATTQSVRCAAIGEPGEREA
jgi:hypothetical protein